MFGINKKLAFGFMRLPLTNNNRIDFEMVAKMVDFFIENGFNYFDTAHGYHSGNSEKAIKQCLTSRYDRSKYLLTNKLTDPYFEKEEDIIPLFNSQLETCGVEYFDFYLMHAQNRQNYQKFKRCHAYETALKLKNQGKIKHLGISFHDTADVLDMILTEHPEIEVVQIQYNYLDYDSKSVQSKKCYDVCVKHNKYVLIMEPIKGGNLVKLPPLASAILENKKIKPASLALRFAASPDNVIAVLSGMSNLEQVKENVAEMKEFRPLNDDEHTAIKEIVKIFKNKELIGCTGCRYCVDGCIKHIPIPEMFSVMNAKIQFKDWNSKFYFNNICGEGAGKPSSCIKCGKCEISCPQHLPIRELLEKVAEEFEK